MMKDGFSLGFMEWDFGIHPVLYKIAKDNICTCLQCCISAITYEPPQEKAVNTNATVVTLFLGATCEFPHCECDSLMINRHFLLVLDFQAALSLSHSG